MTDTAEIRRRNEQAAFNAMQHVWNSHFWLSLAYKHGGTDELAEARRLLTKAIAAIDKAQIAPVQEAAE